MSVIVAVYVRDEVGFQRRLEFLGLLQRDQVFEFEAVEFADSVAEIVHRKLFTANNEVAYLREV